MIADRISLCVSDCCRDAESCDGTTTEQSAQCKMWKQQCLHWHVYSLMKRGQAGNYWTLRWNWNYNHTIYPILILIFGGICPPLEYSVKGHTDHMTPALNPHRRTEYNGGKMPNKPAWERNRDKNFVLLTINIIRNSGVYLDLVMSVVWSKPRRACFSVYITRKKKKPDGR